MRNKVNAQSTERGQYRVRGAPKVADAFGGRGSIPGELAGHNSWGFEGGRME